MNNGAFFPPCVKMKCLVLQGEKSMDCIVSSLFSLELFLKGKPDAFKWIFKSLPPHKKPWLLTAPVQSKHPF